MMMVPSAFPTHPTPDPKGELRRFVAQFPELARRVLALNEGADVNGCMCLVCKCWISDYPDHDPRGCWLRDLRAIVRETELQEALNRG